MEYFIWLLLNLTEVDPRFNYGLCSQMKRYIETEERLNEDDQALWANCSEIPECSEIMGKYYRAMWTCEDYVEYYYEEDEY